MGSPKHAVRLPDGRTMLDWVLASLLRCVPIAAVVGALTDARRPGVLSIPDIHPGRGPLAGIHAALVRLDVAGCLVAACDQPFLDERLLRPLARDPDRACCLVSAASGALLPLPVYVPRSCLARVVEELFLGRGSLHGLLSRIAPDRVTVPAHLEPAVRSLNTPGELRAAFLETQPVRGPRHAAGLRAGEAPPQRPRTGGRSHSLA